MCRYIFSHLRTKTFLDHPHLNDQTTGSTVILGFKIGPFIYLL